MLESLRTSTGRESICRARPFGFKGGILEKSLQESAVVSFVVVVLVIGLVSGCSTEPIPSKSTQTILKPTFEREVFFTYREGATGDPDVLEDSCMEEIRNRVGLDETLYSRIDCSFAPYRAWIHQQPTNTRRELILLIENRESQKLYSAKSPAIVAGPLENARWLHGRKPCFGFEQVTRRRPPTVKDLWIPCRTWFVLNVDSCKFETILDKIE